MHKPMHRCFAVAFAALALSGMGGVDAATPAAEVIEVKPARLRIVFSWEADRVSGEYQLSDGRKLSLTRRGTAVTAHIDGEESRQLRALNAMEMRDAADEMRLRFDTQSEPDTVLVTVTLLRRAGDLGQTALLSGRMR